MNWLIQWIRIAKVLGIIKACKVPKIFVNDVDIHKRANENEDAIMLFVSSGYQHHDLNNRITLN